MPNFLQQFPSCETLIDGERELDRISSTRTSKFNIMRTGSFNMESLICKSTISYAYAVRLKDLLPCGVNHMKPSTSV